VVAAAVTFIVLSEAGASFLHVLTWPFGAGTLTAWLLLRRALRRVRISGCAFPGSWRRVLKRYVRDYTALPKDERARFERDVTVFLDEAEITGVGTRVTDTDRVLVASSAVMLAFGRPGRSGGPDVRVARTRRRGWPAWSRSGRPCPAGCGKRCAPASASGSRSPRSAAARSHASS